MITIVLPNVWNEAMEENEHFISSLDSQKITFSKDEKGLLKVSGVWEYDDPHIEGWHQKSYFAGEKFSFIQDDTLPLNEVTFVQESYTQSIEKADRQVVSFKSTYKKPIILPSYNPKLEVKIIEKLNTQLAESFRQSKVPIEVYPEISKLKKQFAYANTKGHEFVIVIGESEFSSKTLTLKNMTSGMQIEKISFLKALTLIREDREEEIRI